MKFKYFSFTLILSLLTSLSFCLFQANNTNKQKFFSNNQQIVSQQIDEQRLQQINFVINSYFQNCQLDQQQQVLYNCSINKSSYAQFLYGLFHKQLIMNFLKYYQSQGRLKTQTQIAQMYKVGQKVHDLVVSAYNQWVQIYKPNQKITVQQMYGDIIQLDSEVLDIIEHYDDKYNDFIKVLRNVYNISTDARRYIVMGNKTEQQIAEDFSEIYEVYFGDCFPLTQCSLSLKAFIYFVKQIAFYITPLTQQLQSKEDILVSQEMDFQATQFIIKSVNNLRGQLGQKVQYNEIEKYAENIAIDLFNFLKDDYEIVQQDAADQAGQDIQSTNGHQQSEKQQIPEVQQSKQL